MSVTRFIAACVLFALASPASAAGDAGQRDAFGITKKYATAAGGKTWTSAHWGNGKARSITGRDPDDPTGASENRSDQARLYVDGAGKLQFLGDGAAAEPRFHLNAPGYHFKNAVITFYYWKTKDADVDWGGLVVGARSGPEGHSQSSQYCTANTYYARFRNDGAADFEKELKHPASAVRNRTNIWNGATDLPAGKWIGMKYVVYDVTVNGKPAAKLEVYRDLTQGARGGTWEKIAETVDAGGWAPPQQAPACTNKPSDFVPTAAGAIVLRNTGSIKDSYKWLTVREISPSA
ncbi:MAG: hypothetical protein ACREQJ_10720 [Candidatus Binatia bacterium]